MKRLFLAAALISMLWMASPAAAQTPLTLDVVQVQLWPEFDRPQMLVIVTAQLPEDVSLPVTVNIRIPASVGEPFAVAELTGDGQVYTEYTRTVEGEWAVLAVQATSPVVFVEYYDPNFSTASDDRVYEYTWAGEYDVKDMVFSVMQPVNATNMQIDPDLGPSSVGGEGMQVFTNSVGAVAAGEVAALSLSYNKKDSRLVREQTPGDAVADVVDPAASTSGLPSWAWALIGAGAVVLVGGGVYFFTSTRTTSSGSHYRQKKRRSSQARKKSSAGAFCHSCGTQARSGDEFCRVCGVELRR